MRQVDAKTENGPTTKASVSTLKHEIPSKQFVDERGVPFETWQRYPADALEVALKQHKWHDTNKATEHFWRGLYLKARSDPERAFQEFELVGPKESLSDYALANIAETYYSLQLSYRARNLIDYAIARGSKCTRVYEVSAVMYSGASQYANAAGAYINAAKYSADKPDVFMAFAADSWRRAGKVEEAVKILTDERTGKPIKPSASVLICRAKCLAMLHRWKEAADDFSGAIAKAGANLNDLRHVNRASLSPSNYVLMSAYLERSKCYDALGERKRAEADRAMHAQLSKTIEDDFFPKSREK